MGRILAAHLIDNSKFATLLQDVIMEEEGWKLYN